MDGWGLLYFFRGDNHLCKDCDDDERDDDHVDDRDDDEPSELG